MGLFTKKGDDGTTGLFGCDQRMSKSSKIAEALGVLDETNSFLGLVKSKVRDVGFKINEKSFEEIVDEVQHNLFIVQAELAGASKIISAEKVSDIEILINHTEKKLPEIKSFFVPGGCEISALFDIARTISRRAERRVVSVAREGKIKIGKDSLAYLNRLSSLLYAMTRLSNHLSGIKEEPPHYK